MPAETHPSVEPDLTAIDPEGCGCTECLTGQYRPLQDASEAELRALLAGRLRDNTGEWWDLEELPHGQGWDVSVAGRWFTVAADELASPPPPELYRIRLTKESYERLL